MALFELFVGIRSATFIYLGSNVMLPSSMLVIISHSLPTSTITTATTTTTVKQQLKTWFRSGEQRKKMRTRRSREYHLFSNSILLDYACSFWPLPCERTFVKRFYAQHNTSLFAWNWKREKRFSSLINEDNALYEIVGITLYCNWFWMSHSSRHHDCLAASSCISRSYSIYRRTC